MPATTTGAADAFLAVRFDAAVGVAARETVGAAATSGAALFAGRCFVTVATATGGTGTEDATVARTAFFDAAFAVSVARFTA